MFNILARLFASRTCASSTGPLITLLLALTAGTNAWAQTYTSYRVGSSADAIANPMGGLCLMGGATDNDDAIRWFLQRADGGDVLVLRSTGSDSYNDYFYSDMGVSLHSVETIVCLSADASNEPYVLSRIQQAEAIWFAGGDQWDYLRFWRNSPVDSLIRAAVRERNTVIGGTSAGMAIQGQYYFSAENGTVTSPAALANPFNNKVTVDSARFLAHPLMEGVITDTHFDNPDRRGRAMVFLARALTDFGEPALAIACDEYTAVCIDTAGMARVFGAYPAYEDYAYFMQPNCSLDDFSPENCAAGSPLTWDRGGEAVSVYRIAGTAEGIGRFSLRDRAAVGAGSWQHWSVEEGVLAVEEGWAPACSTASLLLPIGVARELNLSPSICTTTLTLTLPSLGNGLWQIQCNSLDGKVLRQWTLLNSTAHILDIAGLPSGIMLLSAQQQGVHYRGRFIKTGQ
ncbi:MAG: cyanophycinase [Bacteroidetes bacterium]|nr:cyanophycinase [Bacteroidota bacterium]